MPRRGNIAWALTDIGKRALFHALRVSGIFSLGTNKKYRLTGYIRGPKGGVGSITAGQDRVLSQPVGELDAEDGRKSSAFRPPSIPIGASLSCCE